MGFLTYLRLKVLASLVRLLVRLTSSLTPPLSPHTTLSIPSRTPSRTIKLHIYASSPPPSTPTPVLLNLHGSGFILPLHGSDDEFCARVARETPYTVLDMQYRLAPEHPFPAALEDAEDAVAWIRNQPQRFNTSQFAISGFSAGGNLAAAVAGAPSFKGVFHALLAFYPSTNKSVAPEDRKTPDPQPRSAIALAMSRLFDECYIPADQNRKDPLVSPIFASGDAYPQNCLFITAAQDNLAFEGEALAAKIEEAGGERRVVRKRMEGCGHAWDKMAKAGTVQGQAKEEAYAMAVEFLKE